MLTKSHRICSIAIVELSLLLTNRLLIDPVNNIIILAATAIGASLPDIDEYNSSASKKSVINFSLFLDTAESHILFLAGQSFLVVYII